MEPQQEDWTQYLFSSEQKRQMFPALQRTESEMQIESNNFDYPSYFRNQPQRSIEEQPWFPSDRDPHAYQKFAEHCKSINGLQGFVTLGEKQKGFNMLDKSSNEEIGLQQFFGEPPENQTPLQKNLSYLRSVFARVNPDLTGNFDNFLYIQESNKHKFLEDFKIEYFNALKMCAKKKQPEMILNNLLDFWVGCMRSMLAAIDKCSPLYTLNLFKKEKENKFIEPEEDLPPSNIYQEDMTSEKRKLWLPQEVARLEQLMDNKIAMSASVLQQLSTELGRSVVAIQTRLQKIQRERRQTSVSYEKQLIEVMKTNKAGITKETIATKLKQNFKITDDGFKKIFYPLLSSSSYIVKTKGVYSLKNFSGKLDNQSNFKNKVISCLLDTPGQRADLRSITKKYIERFARDEGINPEDSERIKTIEANINKALHKYDVFDTSRSKTTYRYIERQQNESVFSSSDWSQSEFRRV